MATKVDLSLLKKLTEELEQGLNAAEEKRAAGSSSHNLEYLVELSKAMGLASSIAFESAALMQDIRVLISQGQGPSKEDAIAKLLGSLSGGGLGGLPGAN